MSEIRKILEKEMSKSGGRRSWLRFRRREGRARKSLDRLNRDVEGLVRMTGNQVAK